MKSVILHIGNPKTGTSAIQSFLSANRERLGVLYPPGAGDSRAAQGDATSGNASAIVRRLQAGEDPKAIAAGLVAGALYSSELFRSVPIRIFRNFLGCVDARIILYVRPQVSAIPSGFAQLKSSEKFVGDLAQYYRSKRDRFKYTSRYLRFRTLSRITVRPFVRDRLANGDIVDDFCSTVGIDIPPDAVRFESVNARERPDIAPDFASRIANYFREDNARLAALSATELGLNEANDAEAQRIASRYDKLSQSR